MDALNDLVLHQHDHSDHSDHDHSDHNSDATTAPTSAGDNSTSDAAGETGGTANQDEAMDHSDHSDHGGMDHMMSPFLFSDTTGFHVLFRQGLVGNTGGFILALAGSLLFALFTTIGFELGKKYEASARRAQSLGEKGSSVKIFIASIVHAVRLLLHYTAMLLVMTMNIWVILAVLVGHGIGFLLYTFVTKEKVSGSSVTAEGKEAGCDVC